jgi:gliding motility-associated-like protein
VTGLAITNATFVWEQSSSATGPWVSVPGGTTQDLPSVSLTNTNAGTTVSYYFHRVATLGKCSQTSTPIEVKVSGGMTAGTIGPLLQTICMDGTTLSGKISSTAPATGGTTSPIEYEWESSLDGSTGWTSLGARSSTNLDYSPTTVPTANLYYRRKAYAGTGLCDNATTTPVEVALVAPSVATILTPVSVTSPNTSAYTFNDTLLAISASPTTTGYKGSWTLSPKGVLVSPANSASNTVAGMSFDDQSTLVWEVKDDNGICPSAKATINLTRKNITVAYAPDDSLCETSLPYGLVGNGLISGETASWTFVSATPSVTPVWAIDPTDQRKATITSVAIPANAGKVDLFFKYTVTSTLAPTPSSQTVKITVYQTTQTATIVGPINTCASFVQLTGNQPSQATASGKWVIVSGQGSLADATVFNTNLNGLNAIGTTNLTWTISNHLCLASTATLDVNQKGQSTDALISISGGAYSATDITNKTDVALCTGVAYTLNAVLPSTGLKPGETGLWSSSSTPTITGSTTSLPFTSSTEGNADAKWTITPSIAGCTPSIATATFKIGGKPVLDVISTPDELCENTTSPYSVTLSTSAGVNNLPILLYTWSDMANTPSTTGKATLQGAGTGSNVNFLFTSSATTGASDKATLSVSATNACGTSTALTKLVTIDLVPRDFTGTITGKDSICQSATGTETYQIPAQSNVTEIDWTLGTDPITGLVQPALAPAIDVSTIVAKAPSVLLTATLKNACGTGVFKTKVIGIKPAKDVIANLIGQTVVCLPIDANTYTGTTSNGGTGSTYAFAVVHKDLSVGKTQANSSNPVFVTAAGDLQDGDQINLVVTADPTNGCFSGTGIGTASLTIDGYVLPDTTVANYKDTICSGDVISLCPLNTSTKGNVKYEWFKSGVMVNSTSTGACFSLTNSSESGAYTLKVTNSVCGPLSSMAKTVKIYDTPTVRFDPSEISMELAVTPTMVLQAQVDGLTVDTLTMIEWSPTTLINPSKDTLRTMFSPPNTGGEFVYKIQVATGHGTHFCSSENTIKIRVFPAVRVPNAFSPNDDGKNDTWQIDGIEAYPNAKVSVFNRWGNKIFTAHPYNGQNGWDGRENGAEVAYGTYYYIIDLGENTAKQSRNISGSLTIVR